MNRSIWQVSGGPPNRGYASVFLKHGVALIGPGDAGPWLPERGEVEFDGNFVRRFATEVQPGDVILLRTGLATIEVVGLIVGPYEYLSQFDDVNGWDLQHARRVRWCRLPDAYIFEAAVFGGSPPRISQINQPAVVEYAIRFVNSPPTAWQTAPLPALPAEEPPLVLIPAHLQNLVAQVDDWAKLYWDRDHFGEHPTEDELLSHFAVPMLIALGWPVERIAIKWRYIDVSVFKALPRTPENCHFIIEAKRLGAGVEGALKQAKDYLNALGIQRDIVLTDGLRYRLYATEQYYMPVAYANLARLKQSSLSFFNRIKRP